MEKSSITKPLPDPVKEYILAEYAEIRTEIRIFMNEINMLARYAVILTGLIWAWLLKEGDNSEIIGRLGWLPLVISLLFAWKAFTLRIELIYRGRYIQKLEREFDLPNNLG